MADLDLAADRRGAAGLALPARPPDRRLRRSHGALAGGRACLGPLPRRSLTVPRRPQPIPRRPQPFPRRPPHPGPRRKDSCWPAEWERHAGTFLAWPHDRDTWGADPPRSEDAFTLFAWAIGQGETAQVLVKDARMEERVRARLGAADVGDSGSTGSGRGTRGSGTTGRSWWRRVGEGAPPARARLRLQRVGREVPRTLPRRHGARPSAPRPRDPDAVGPAGAGGGEHRGGRGGDAPHQRAVPPEPEPEPPPRAGRDRSRARPVARGPEGPLARRGDPGGRHGRSRGRHGALRGRGAGRRGRGGRPSGREPRPAPRQPPPAGGHDRRLGGRSRWSVSPCRRRSSAGTGAGSRPPTPTSWWPTARSPSRSSGTGSATGRPWRSSGAFPGPSRGRDPLRAGGRGAGVPSTASPQQIPV